MVGGRPFREIVLETFQRTVFIMAVGACASFSGILRATVSQGVGVREVVKGEAIVNPPTFRFTPSI